MSVLVTAWMLVFARVAGLLATMPVLGAAGVPALARLGAAVPLAVLLLPVGGSVVVPETLSALLGALILEMLLGTAMGFCMQVAFAALGVAADLTSSQAGLSMGAMFDPVSMSQPGAIGAQHQFGRDFERAAPASSSARASTSTASRRSASPSATCPSAPWRTSPRAAPRSRCSSAP